MRNLKLSGAQRRALQVAVDAPLGLARISSSYHGTPDREDQVLSRVVQGLERQGLLETRHGSFGSRVFATERGRAELADLDRALAVLEVQGDLFAEGGAA